MMKDRVFRCALDPKRALQQIAALLAVSVALICGVARGNAEAVKQHGENTNVDLVVEHIDSSTGEKYFVIFDDSGVPVGWMEADGATYDAEGKLVARLDGTGRVVASDGSTLFSPHLDTAEDYRKLAYARGAPPKVRFNRLETLRASIGALQVAPLCVSVFQIVRAFNDIATAERARRGCIDKANWIADSARIANNFGMCLQTDVPTSKPSLWGC
jgi:hypothetical protein